jgi:hypothetical protein
MVSTYLVGEELTIPYDGTVAGKTTSTIIKMVNEPWTILSSPSYWNTWPFSLMFL